jgi:hypothetical protein
MDVPRALAQIDEIHDRLAKAEVYRGYRSVPVAASGVIGLAAAWLQPPSIGAADPIGFIFYWTAIAALASFVGVSEVVYNYVVEEDRRTRRRTRTVISQLLPSLLAGAIIAVSFARLSAALVPLVPGIWAICFGVGIFASRLYLPAASGWVALYYYAAGVALLWSARGIGDAIGETPRWLFAAWLAPLSGWTVGGTFGVGQLFAALVLYRNLERDERNDIDEEEETN